MTAKARKKRATNARCIEHVTRALPASVLRRVLQFIPTPKRRGLTSLQGPILGDDMIPESPSPIPEELQASLCALSPTYSAIVDELLRDVNKQSMTIDFESRNAAFLQKIYDRVARDGATVHCLHLRAGGERGYRRFTLFPGLSDIKAFDTLAIDWARIFAAFPNLRRLDLWSFPLHSTQLVKVLDAASLHCKILEALVLPKDENGSDSIDSAILPVLEMLETALKRWYNHGVHRGLRQLRVPQRVTNLRDSNFDFQTLNGRFVLAVSRYCPNLEYLDGYKLTFSARANILCDEYLCCSIDAWRAFCQSCPCLRELNWFIVPYLDPFFEIFGQYPKHNLTSLVLAGGEHIESCGFGDSDMYDNKYTFSSTGLAQLFQGCPRLRHLKIVYTSGGDDGFDAGVNRQEAMDDQVLLSIAQNCLELDTIEIVEIQAGQDIAPMSLITDAGFEAIASLPRLMNLHFKPTQCGARGILALMEHAPDTGDPRKATIEIMNLSDKENDEECETRNEMILMLLDMVFVNAETLCTRRFDVTVKIIDELQVQPDEFLQQCAALLDAMDPSIIVRLKGEDGDRVDFNFVEKAVASLQIISNGQRNGLKD